MRIGIIGVGKIGAALVKGLVNAGLNPQNIYVYDVSTEATERVRQLSVAVCKSAEEVASVADIVIVAVKPHDVIGVVKGVALVINENKVLVSVAAFIPIKFLERHIHPNSVYRAMPNIAIEVNSGFTALAPTNRRNENVEKVFSLLGDVVWVSEEVLDLLTIMSASTPAIVAELLDAFILAALKAGIPYEIARKASSTVFQGVGKLAKFKDLNTIRDAVITPRGTTIALLEKFYEYEVKNRLLKTLTENIEEYLEKLKKFREELEKLH